MVRASPVPCGPVPSCSPTQQAAVTAIPGVVFSGSLDRHLRAYSTKDGTILWDLDTVRDYKTVNHVNAKGGAIDGPGAIVINGMVFVNSGYARQGGIPGNLRWLRGNRSFVPRPLENGPDHPVDTTPDASFDVTAAGFLDLAEKLGA